MSLLPSTSNKRKHQHEDDNQLSSSKRIRSPDGSAVKVESSSSAFGSWAKGRVANLLHALQTAVLHPSSFMEARARGMMAASPSPPLPSSELKLVALPARSSDETSTPTSLPSPAPSRPNSPPTTTDALPKPAQPSRPTTTSLSDPYSSHASSSKVTLNTPPSPPSSSASSHRTAKGKDTVRQRPSKLKLAHAPERDRPWLNRSVSDVSFGWATTQDDPQDPQRTPKRLSPARRKTNKTQEERFMEILEREKRKEMHLQAYRAQRGIVVDASTNTDEASLSALRQMLAGTNPDWTLSGTNPSSSKVPPPSSPHVVTLQGRLADQSPPSVFDGLSRRLNISQKSRKDSRREQVFMPELDSLKIRDEESDKKIAARLAKLAPKLPAKLTDAQEAEVEALHKKGRSHVSRCNREQVTFADLERLRPRQWANDEIMNYYGTMIQDAADARVALAAEGKLPKDEALSLHYFSTFFFAKLESPGYEKAKLARWTKKIDLFKKDLELIPIHQGNAHWTSAEITFKHKRIEAYDSMGEGSARSIFEKLKGYLQSESMDKKKVPFDFTGWEMYTDHKTTPQQLNGYDCGIFSCQVLESVSRGQGYGNWAFGQENMLYLRRRMMLEIARAKLLNHPASAP